VPKTPRLREWRERAALSQGELAARSGTSRATIADLEAGNRGGQPKTVRRLAEALGIEPEDLYGEAAYPKEAAPPDPQPSFNGLLEEERRTRISERLEASAEALGRVYAEELADPNSLYRRDVNYAVLLEAQIRKHVVAWAEWAEGSMTAFLSDSDDVEAIRGYLMRVLLLRVRLLMMAEDLKEHIDAMKERPDELAQRRLQAAQKAVQENLEHLEERRQAVGE
jgi:HTH-type transcriptional regulator, competence development regulator